MSRSIVALLAAALGASALAASALAASGVTVAPVEGPTFPERAFVLHLPERDALGAPRVRVLENGGRVKDLGLVPANASRSIRRGLVVVVDASNSMRGEPIRAAMIAARTLATRRTPGQRMALVTFNARPTVRLRPTGDVTAITSALTLRPSLAEGTYFYDALDSALNVAAAGGMRSPTIVLLSDGADTGSRARAEDVIAKAKDRGARFFTVGLKSDAFVRSPLEALAQTTGGTYAEAASTAELGPVFDRLGYQLANEYVVEYLSLAGPKENVRVSFLVEGVGAAKASYVTPALPRLPTPAFERAAVDRFWSSGATMIVTALLVAALLAAAALVMIRPKNRLLRKRLSEFVTMEPSMQGDGTPRAALPGRVFAGADKSLSQLQLWPRFKEELEIAQIRMPAVQIVLWTAVGTVIAVMLLNGFAGMPAALAGLGVPVLVRMLIKHKLYRRQYAFAEQLPENLQVLGSALRAGHSLIGALSVVVADAPDPAKTEFQRVVADEQLGIPIEESLTDVARRMACPDLEQVALVAAVGRQTGGNTAEVLDQVTKVVRERFELRRLVRGLTAQGRLSNWVLSLLPPALVVVISIINREYMDPLLNTGTGRALMVFAAGMIITGSLIIRKIVNIKV